MLQFTKTKPNFSERPSYNASVVDDVFARYCTVATVNATRTITKGGIDVTKRRDAILKSLNVTNHSHIFGELEMGLLKR